MKLKKSFFISFGVFVLAVFSFASISGCSNNLDSMLKEYNKAFDPPEEPDVVHDIDDPLFDESEMLLDIYPISQDAVLNLCAPPDCAKYKWQIYNSYTKDETDRNAVAFRQFSGIYNRSGSSQRLVINIPTSNLKSGTTYRLKLTVTDSNDNKFVDYASLAIYYDYYYGTGIITVPSNNTAFRSVSGGQVYSTAAARTITPGAYKVSDLYYYVTAKNLRTDVQIGPFPVTVTGTDDAQVGNLVLNLPVGNYYLVLFALKELPAEVTFDTINENAVLTGFAEADFRYTSGFDFNLNPSYAGTGTGTISLKVYSDKWSFSDSAYIDYEVETELWHKDNSTGTETLVTPANINTKLEKSAITDLTAPENFNYSVDVPAGTYKFNVILKKDDNSYYWSNSIIVVKGKGTEAEFPIPSIIDAE